jgi:hypothetical protein
MTNTADREAFEAWFNARGGNAQPLFYYREYLHSAWQARGEYEAAQHTDKPDDGVVERAYREGHRDAMNLSSDGENWDWALSETKAALSTTQPDNTQARGFYCDKHARASGVKGAECSECYRESVREDLDMAGYKRGFQDCQKMQATPSDSVKQGWPCPQISIDELVNRHQPSNTSPKWDLVTIILSEMSGKDWRNITLRQLATDIARALIAAGVIKGA